MRQSTPFTVINYDRRHTAWALRFPPVAFLTDKNWLVESRTKSTFGVRGGERLKRDIEASEAAAVRV